MIILITGATDGIGLETARQLAMQGHELVLHGRSEAKLELAKTDILRSAPQAHLQSVCADFAHLGEVLQMAQELSIRLPHLDVLINNAGVYLKQCAQSQDGFEMTLVVNHLAHFLLTLHLLPLLKNSTAPRVVTVSSMVHSDGRFPFAEMNCKGHYDGYQAYANSKLANSLFARELARREAWLRSNSLHPGVIGTKLLHAAFNIHGDDVRSGAETSVYLATSEKVAGMSGKYFDHCAVVASARQVEDLQLAQQLWAWSMQAVQPWLQK